MNTYLVAFRVDTVDDDYIRSISEGICPMSQIYRAIYSNFCDGIRRNKRKVNRNAKANSSTAKKKRKDVKDSKDTNSRGRRSTSRKATKGGKRKK